MSFRGGGPDDALPSSELNIKSIRGMEGQVGENGVFSIVRASGAVEKYARRREGDGINRQHLSHPRTFLLGVECTDQPVESVIQRHRETNLLSKLLGIVSLGKGQTANTESIE